MNPGPVPKRRTRAFDVRAIRNAVIENAVVPPELLQKAFKTLDKHINAKKTLYFTHQGKVEETVDVEDHETQQRAIDKVFRIADIYSHERDSVSKNAVSAIRMTIDPKTGVMSLIIGGEVDEDLDSAGNPEVIDIDASVSTPALEAHIPESDPEPEVETVKVHRIKGLPADVYRTLYEDP